MRQSPKTLPWCHNGNGLIFGQCSGEDDEAPLIADVITEHDRAPFGLMLDEELRNAVFIITACNLHSRLMAAVVDLLGDRPDVQSGQCVHCGRDYTGHPDVSDGNCPADDCPAHKARLLLAAAEEAQP